MSRGRRAIKFDPATASRISELRAQGATLDQVAGLTGLSVPTLYKLYACELKKGEALANLAVGKRLFDKCMDGDIKALIFWAKTRMGWSEKTRLEVSNPDRSLAPLPATPVDLSSMQAKEIISLVRAAFAGE